ncbi:MAG TPA: VanW family protein [Candidatus Limnocylindrales bacterium]|nr:VanW family protein [Candidatus Limnocylindrales bacterium]
MTSPGGAHDAVPTRGAALRFGLKAWTLRCLRAVRDVRGGSLRRPARPARKGDVLLAQSVSLLRGDAGTSVRERMLTNGKIQNLRLAVRRVDGCSVAAGEVFSFWHQVGRATRRRGFAAGRELRQGCTVPSVGGGLCQLSNALYDAALGAGCQIVERHAHTQVVPGSLAEIGRDATVFWNYVDLRFRAKGDIRIEAVLSADVLAVRFWGTEPLTIRGQPDAPSAGAITRSAVDHGAGDCASCGVEQCFRHRAGRRTAALGDRTAFLLDGVWPEFDAYVGSVARRDDPIFVPLDGRRRGIVRYAWDTSSADRVYETPLFTMLRSYRSRRLASHGAARQRALIASARALAERYAKRLPYDATHLVVMQHLLPALWAGGHLGGRTYDVLMTGLPMADVQRELDRALTLHPESATVGDFRAEPSLVEAEAAALAGCRRIVTPHAAVAARFGERAVRLPWYLPKRDAPAETAARRGVVFPASTLGRYGAYELREVARRTGLHVILTGPDLEADGFWNGVSVSRAASFTAALLRARAVALPAFVENQPRRLLLAAAAGVPVVASYACGLHPGDGVSLVEAGDVAALHDALVPFLSNDIAPASDAGVPRVSPGAGTSQCHPERVEG